MAFNRGRIAWAIALGAAALCFTWFSWPRISSDATVHGIDFGAIFRSRGIAILQVLCAMTMAMSHIRLTRLIFYILCILTVMLLGTDIHNVGKFVLDVPVTYYIIMGASFVITVGALASVARQSYLLR